MILEVFSNLDCFVNSAVSLHRLRLYHSSRLYCSSMLDSNVCSSPRDSDCICCLKDAQHFQWTETKQYLCSDELCFAIRNFLWVQGFYVSILSGHNHVSLSLSLKQ